MIDRAEQLALVLVASRAPSAHNTQPARWRFTDNGVVLYEDARRRLRVGDPTGRDAMIGVGAALEALHLALGQRAMGITGVERADASRHDPPPGMHCVARATIGAGRPDALFEAIERRRSYRGRFVEHTTLPSELRRATEATGDVVIVSDRSNIRALAELHDDCTYSFIREPAYLTELREWMRFTPDDPRWFRDGLTAECLALGGVERALASVFLKPGLFALLDRIGGGRAAFSEGHQIRSAAGVVILHRPLAEDPVATGRAFFRLWLEIARVGLSACPMSSTADAPRGQDELRARFGISPDRRVINLFRVGLPRAPVPRSARLPAEELLV